LGQLERTPKKENINLKVDASQPEVFEGFPEGINPQTGEKNGPSGPEPSRYGDWERKGRVSDF